MASARLEGEIRNWDSERNFGFITFINNRGSEGSIFYSGHNIRPDWKGSRSWAFSPGIPVSFRVSTKLRKNHEKAHAEDVDPIFPMSEPEDLAGYRETSEVFSKIRDYGFLKRPCGDLLFFHVQDVIEQYRNRWRLLEIGSPVYHSARFDEETQRWRASYIELYSYEELWNFKNEEGEP
jgi:cold shock CspA family protein